MDLELLNNLSDKEKEAVLEILNQYSNTGSSQRLNQLILNDYKEIPVDIITFIKDSKYLGKAWHTSDGKCKLFPYWEEKLKQLFPDPYTTNYNTFIESGARGIGKSEIAITCGLYMMYRAMCLKNPLEYFNLKPTEKLAFAFMNITEALAYDIGVSKFQATVQMSPWFLERGTLSGRDEIIWNPPSYINLIVGSQPRHVIGQAVLYAFFDEISFIPNQDVDKQKQKAIDMIDTAIGGMKTRFLHEGRSPALLILASSKRSDKSFLEVHTKKKIETEGENLLLVDEPVWNIRPASDYSGRRFYVAQGNKYLSSEVLDLNVTEQDLKIFKLKGYKIISVPIEYKNNFQEDIDRALCDFAGVSSSDVTKYISGSRLQEIISKDYQNPFTKEVIEVGNGPEDFAQYSDFFDLTKVPASIKSKPLYIHLDMSLSGDKTGIAGTFIIGKKASLENSPKELYFQLAFGVAIKAPKGYQVSFAKNREFIYWLKQQGFNIKGITTDTYQNAALAQDLISKGYNYSVLSLDRVDNQSKICIPYAYFKNTIYEKRVKIYNCDLLIEEILGLERNETNGRIDHPDGGRIGSKDICDAFAGSLYNASQHADEFNFEYGETLESIVDVSSQGMLSDQQLLKQQFEEELNNLFDPMSGFLKQQKEQQKKENPVNNNKMGIDFGMGIAKPLSSNQFYISNGIII